MVRTIIEKPGQKRGGEKRGDKPRETFACADCGHESPRWMGFCPSPLCGSARPLTAIPSAPPRSSIGAAASAPAWMPAADGAPVELSAVSRQDCLRISLESTELDRVLGGGIVPGSALLLAGEPGVGKSTLLLQLAHTLAARRQSVVYVAGEESPRQIKLRSDRLGIAGGGIRLLPETDTGAIFRRLEQERPALLVVDSIQTLHCQTQNGQARPGGEASGPGSVAQVREAGLLLLRWAKATGTPVCIAGHMTKDGALAGPRVLEHMVDVVLYLEAQEPAGFRLLRAAKNRFGSTEEVGVFRMTERGLADVPDPSQVALSQAARAPGAGPPAGSVLTATLEGSRALLLEVQALTAPSPLPAPRRVAHGFDHGRLLLLAAVGARRAGLELAGQDIIVNIAGGFRVAEPAGDLAAALAVASCLRNQPLPAGCAAFGEVGLSGELRNVPQAQRRLNEAARLGLTQVILPQSSLPGLEPPPGLTLTPAPTLRQAINSISN